jgi:hypothetical protein
MYNSLQNKMVTIRIQLQFSVVGFVMSIFQLYRHIKAKSFLQSFSRRWNMRFSDEIAAYEDKCELVRVLVVAPPNGVVLLVGLVPEVGNGFVFNCCWSKTS